MQQSRRRRASENRNEDTHSHFRLQRRPQLPEPPTNQTPSRPPNQGSTQESEYPAGYDVTSVPYPRHYVTELSGLESEDSGYEVPSNHAVDHHEEDVYQEIEDDDDNYEDTELTQL